MHDFDWIPTLITIAAVMAVVLGTCAMLIYAERKVSAWMQDRHGPNRVGPWGLFQSVADGLKFLLKEDIIPAHVDRVLYLVAPSIAIMTALLAFAVVPFGPTTPAPVPPLEPAPLAANATEAERAEHDRLAAAFPGRMQEYRRDLEAYRSSYQFVIAPGLSIGILFVLAVSSLNVYAVILGGWSANNKYSMLGGLRSSAQVISYEIPMGMSILGVVLLAGSLNLEQIIAAQVDSPWFIFFQPLAFLLFMTSAFAETNRLPFDLPEAEQELVGGYHTEYSAMKFAMFFLGEYTHMITSSFLMVILFFGGWHFPWLTSLDLPWVWMWVIKLAVVLAKVFAFIMFYMLIRWTIPRFRFDQLMALAWKVMIPLALVNLVAVMFVQEFCRDQAWAKWLLLPFSLVIFIAAAALGTMAKPGGRPKAGVTPHGPTSVGTGPRPGVTAG